MYFQKILFRWKIPGDWLHWCGWFWNHLSLWGFTASEKCGGKGVFSVGMGRAGSGCFGGEKFQIFKCFSLWKKSFLKEAKITAKFIHAQNIVTIYDVFSANDTVYLVMEYLQGDSVGRRMKKDSMSLIPKGKRWRLFCRSWKLFVRFMKTMLCMVIFRRAILFVPKRVQWF